MDIKICEFLTVPLLEKIQKWTLDDEKDLEALRDLITRYSSIKAGITTVNIQGIHTKNKSCTEDKENFLMPAPKERPFRVRKLKTMDVDEEMKVPRSSRVTRSSRMTSVLLEDVSMTKKPMKNRTTRSTLQALSPGRGPVEVPVISDSDSSFTGESQKGRRGTKRVKSTAPRASRRGTRNSSHASASTSTRASTRTSTRASTRTSTRASNRASSRASKKFDVSVVKANESVKPTRATRAGAGKVGPDVNPEESLIHFKSPIPTDPQPSKKKTKQKSLFSPYGKSTVKARVEAFEGLSSLITEHMETKNKVKENVHKGEQTDESHQNTVNSNIVVETSVLHVEDKVFLRVGSPMVKGKNKLSYKKINTTLIKEEVDQDVSTMEVEEMDVVLKELLETSNTGEESVSAKQLGGNKNDLTFSLSANEEKKDENEADDEWMTDDEDKTSGSQKEIHSCTPERKTSSSSKLAQDVVGSYKALRSRKVNKTSTEVSLTLSSKAKPTRVLPKNASNVLKEPQKPAESENKETELKRQHEKEMEAIKRKEELLKKRTETTKKKREEKMSKVKKTREEKEKELEAKKAKKAKQPAKKKKVKEVEPEEEVKKTPVNPVVAPMKEKQLDSTFTMAEEEESGGYNMTPHWADVSPKQPENSNDYGVVDKSDCSSEEENDPRKKVPLWTKQIRSELLYQSFIPVRSMHEFWQTKPRALNIEVLFGNKVSKNTLKRGLHCRTSSAIWHTPPIKIQALD